MAALEDFDFAGDFSAEHAKLDGVAFRVNRQVDFILNTLNELSMAWQDSESEAFISGCRANCDEIKALITKAIDDAKSDLDQIAGVLNS